MKRLLSLMKEELRLFLSSKVMMILYLGGPILYGAMFGWVYVKGKFTDMPIIVIDRDHSVHSRQLIDMLDQTEVLRVKAVSPEAVFSSEVFLHDAAYAAVIIPDHFEADLLRRKRPELNVYINNTNLLASGYVNRAILAASGTLNSMVSAKMGRMNEAFHLNSVRLFNKASNYFMFIWPSYLAIILQSVVMVVVALSFSVFAGKGDVMVMAGKLLPYWILSFVLLGIYGIYFLLFRQAFPENTGAVIFITFLFTVTNSFIGMIAGLTFKSQLRSLQFLMILSMPIYISSGFSWPYDQDGLPAKVFSSLFPYMPYVNGCRILLIERGAISDISGFVLMQIVQVFVYGWTAYLLLHRFRK